MRTVALLALILITTTAAGAEVQIIQQGASFDALAWSSCSPDDPLADFQFYSSEEVIGTSSDFQVERASSCGEARGGAAFEVTRAAASISGSFGASSYLDAHGSISSSFSASIRLRVDTPTTFILTCAGTTTESGDVEYSGHGIIFAGGDIDHSTEQAPDFDLQWSGTLQPGEDYRLSLLATSIRQVSDLPGGGTQFQDGETSQLASFTLQFDSAIVRSDERSVGELKSRY